MTFLDKLISIGSQKFPDEILKFIDAEINSHVTWFWLASGLCLAFLVPKAKSLVFVLCVLIAFLPPSISFFLVLFAAAILIIKFGLRSIPEGTSSLVLRLGKYSRTLGPGIHIILPGIERIHVPLGLVTINDEGEQLHLSNDKGLITMKEFLLDPPPHDMICSDNSIVNVDSLAFLRISTPQLAAFGVENLGDAFIKLVETVLRQEVGKLNADEVIQSRDIIGSRLQQALTIASEPWGTTVIRVEIQDITFKRELQEALSRAREEELAGRAKVVAAERTRDALIAKAEGEKKSVELSAEAELAMAQAKAQAEFLHESRRREGEAQGLQAITEALKQSPEALLKLEAIKQQPEIAKGLANSNGLLVVPSDVAGLIGATATVLKSLEAIKSSGKTDE